MKKILIIGMLIVLATCSFLLGDTFEDVSASYLSTYGSPEDEYIYESTGYCSIDWWWWSQGFMVNFVNDRGNKEYGWVVDHEYSFSPI